MAPIERSNSPKGPYSYSASTVPGGAFTRWTDWIRFCRCCQGGGQNVMDLSNSDRLKLIGELPQNCAFVQFAVDCYELAIKSESWGFIPRPWNDEQDPVSGARDREKASLALADYRLERSWNFVPDHLLSHDGLAYILAKHVAIARGQCPSLAQIRITPHVLRHSIAMDLLQHRIDRSVIALWLGHQSMETTQIYLHDNLKLKEEALAKTKQFKGRAGRFRLPDQLLAFLQSL